YSTPRLDALAAEGIRFENCHSTPLCTPSRVNIMSGKSNVFNYQDFGIYPKGEPTFANHFKKFGYATAVAGKWQLYTTKGGISPAEAGFDTYCLWNIPGTGRERYWEPSLLSDGEIMDLPKRAYGPEVATDFLIDFIETNKNRPFLVYYPMILVHNPFPPTPDSADQNETDGKKNFVDMVGYMDKCIGRIVDTLTANGLRDRTLVIFTGDNGTNSQLSSRLNGKEVPGGKGYTHDYGTHVPLIANLPGKIPAGQVNDDLICFSDFFPTIVQAAGLKPKKITDADGWSFWPQCRGERGKKRQWIYGYYFPRPYSDKFDDKYKHWKVRYARDKRYKLYDNGEMYDTVGDVMETAAIGLNKQPEKMMTIRKKLQGALDSYPKSGRGIKVK
ncbi:MAG: sulfatase-like hydrolase/transferase, partial [Planctomycetes bacterium]|nr:sulfatase-like hydrolase/transferase [Planctomycetota bacterium]